MTKQKERTRKLVVTAMLAALSAALMFFEFPLTFIAPAFYELDFSEIPVLIGSFSIGPVAGVAIEFVKILIKFVIKGTSTGGVGELANFLIGISLVLPSSLIYKFNKSRKFAIIGMIIGTVAMTIMGVVLNTFVLIPMYSAFMPIEQIIQMGKDIVPMITDTFTFCIFCVAPFNIVKGIMVSVVTFFLYKPLSGIIHGKALENA